MAITDDGAWATGEQHCPGWRERVCQATRRRGHLTPSAHGKGNQPTAGSGFNQFRNEFLTAARRVATSNKQTIGEVVEWAGLDAFKYGHVGRMTEADTTKLRAAAELVASAAGGAEDGWREPRVKLS